MLRSLWNQVVAKLAQAWNWLLGQTTIDEQIEEKVDNAKRTIIATKERVEDVVEEVQERVARVKEEVADVVDAIEEVVDQAEDVIEAAKGSARKGRKSVERKPAVKRTGSAKAVTAKKVTKSSLRELKKQDLIDLAKKEFNQELDSSLTKTNLINKVYELHHKK